MSYYSFNRQELLQKAKGKYHIAEVKKKLLNITCKIKMLYKKANNKYKNLSEEEKRSTKVYQKDSYRKTNKNQANFCRI